MDDSTKNLIQSHIDTNEVCLFMKGTPDAPQCGFSMATSNILKILEVNYKGINVLESQALREGIKELILRNNLLLINIISSSGC
jgi:monothiol glutaredoxin